MRYGGIENNILSIIEKSLKSLFLSLNIQPTAPHQLNIELEIPKERFHGDIATNVAMKMAKFASKAPFEFANLLKTKIETEIATSHLAGMVEALEVKPPGFLNFFLSKKYLYRSILEIKRRKHNFGSSGIGRNIKLQVEFVSANPTGPLTIAHGRQAAVGDSLANILEFLGYSVTREYYLNDEGTQMDILGNSIRVRYKQLFGIQEEFPADGYKGAYIGDIAKAFKGKYKKRFIHSTKDDIGPFREFGLRWMLSDIRRDLKDFGVKFNAWYSQRVLRKSGKVEKAIAILKDKGYIYEKEGAVWFRSQPLGDDKDRVVVKSDGSTTYLAPDIAYHLEKFRRGFKRIIDIWGPDHHGYVPRLRAAVKALGFSENSLSVLIVQLATVYRNGQSLSMSTRAGEFITLREVMDEVGKDVTRFCFIMRRLSSHLDFDLEVVKKESMENPVYYIQYAHARIWSILKHRRKARVIPAKFDSKLLKENEELELLRILRQFPLVVNASGRSLEPHIILQYLQDLATVFHSFYTKHRVVSDDVRLTKARLVLVDCVRIVLANGLGLVGVSLPKKM